MTWVIGIPSFFGYAFGISDIRVSWPDGTVRDCLQKIYPVGRFIAAGFAGSVEFGFMSIDDLRRYVYLADPNKACVPGKVAFTWYRRARAAFRQAPKSLKQLGAEIMLLGVSPTVDLGIPGWARPMVAIMRQPDFFPHVVPINEIQSIGSGSVVKTYLEELRGLSGEWHELMKLEVGGRGNFAATIRQVINTIIKKHPEGTVSPHVHLCLVRRGSIQLSTSDHSLVALDGTRTEFRMPPVVSSWPDFRAHCVQIGTDATAATCRA